MGCGSMLGTIVIDRVRGFSGRVISAMGWIGCSLMGS